MKAPYAVILAGVLLTCACGGPSVRYKKDINHMIASGNYDNAVEKIEKSKKDYPERNASLYYSILGVAQHDAGKNADSDASLSAVQEYFDVYASKNALNTAAQVLVNDNTAPYIMPAYEQALIYYYRAMNFLAMGNLSGALVEARRAVFFLDNRRASTKSKYKDDPFVQYFASLLFESEGNRSSARIARANSFNAYAQSLFGVPQPDFPVPQNLSNKGEIIFVHYNGVLPVKVARTFQVAWNDVWIAINEASEEERPDAQLQNSIMSAFARRSLTISYPELADQPFKIKRSVISAGNAQSETQLMSDLAVLAKADLEEQRLSQWGRMILRAATKMALAEGARSAARNTDSDDASTAFMVAGLVLDIFNAATEKADTRQLFTLPAEIRMSRLFVDAGVYDINFEALGYDGESIENKLFKSVQVPRGGRVFLYHRTAK